MDKNIPINLMKLKEVIAQIDNLDGETNVFIKVVFESTTNLCKFLTKLKRCHWHNA